MTTTRQHIEDLDAPAWAALTKRAAAASVAAAQRLGQLPSAELLAVVAMTERDLVEHRNRYGPAQKRLSAVLRLVEADHSRVVAEGHARQAQQDKKDAEAAASVARAEAEQSARDVTAARERVREVQAQAARRDADRAAERATAQQAIEQVRGELQRVRADAAAGAATASEQISAAEARAEQRITERAAERATAQQAFEQLRAELERVRADAAAEVAAARAQASGAIARAEADDARLLTVPIPPLGVGAHTGRIEHAVSAARQIDYVLEAGLNDDVALRRPVDIELVRNLVQTVQEQARDLSEQLRNLPLQYTAQWQVEAADSYANAAAHAYGGLLQRIAMATEQLRQDDERANAEVVAVVTRMLADHPWRRH